MPAATLATQERVEFIFEMVSELAPNYPDVAISEAVNYEGLIAPDVALGVDPVFVTLPIFQANTMSRNGVFYDEMAAQAVVDAINNRRIGGGLGHIPPYDRGYIFDTFNIYWVGAIMDSGGKVWGKFYVPTTESRLREYVRICGETQGRMGTSIYGYAEEVTEDNRVIGLYVEQIDLGHPDRLGIPLAAGLPLVTTEMERTQKMTGQANNQTPPASVTSEGTPAQGQAPQNATITESAAVAELNRRISDLTASNTDLNTRNRALVNQAADSNAVRELLGVAESDDLVSAVRTMRDTKAELAAENTRLLADRITSEVAEKVKVPSVRPVVVAMVSQSKPDTLNKVKSEVEKTLSLDYIKSLLASEAANQMGSVPPTPQHRESNDTSGGVIQIPTRPSATQ